MHDRYTTTIRWSCRQNDHWHNITLSTRKRNFSRAKDIEKVPRIKAALQVHMVRRLFNILKFPYLELFNLATEKPSFTQYYGQYTTCGHKRNSIVDSHGVFVKPIINQLKNGFIIRFVRLVFTMIASVCGYQSNDNKFLHFDIW